MRAALWKDYGVIDVCDVPKPAPGPGAALLRVMSAGLCATDLHVYTGKIVYGKPPHILGHEIAGVVQEIGPRADPAWLGRRVVVETSVGCGHCERCLNEEDNLCAQGAAIGVRQPGGFGSHVLVPHPRHLVDPGGLDPAVAATYACSGLTVYSAIRKIMPLPPDKPVVVIGAGGLGLSAIAILKALGHRNIICVDVAEAKRQAALADARLADPRFAQAAETALNLGIDDRRQLQTALAAGGFDPGGVDGVLGPRSRAAIAAWQKSRGEPATGFLSAAQRQALIAATAGASPISR